MDLVDGHTDRLIPVTQIDLGDIDWSLAEMDPDAGGGQPRLRDPRGARSQRPRDELGPAAPWPDRSPTPTSSRSGTPPRTSAWPPSPTSASPASASTPGWANNGADNLNTFSLLNMLVASQIGPQLLVGALVYDGVLERHPPDPWWSWRRSASTGCPTWSPPWT